LKLFELPEDDSLLPDDHFIEVEDAPGYQAAYSRLAFAGDRVQSSIPGEFFFCKLVLNLRIFIYEAKNSLQKLPTHKSTLLPVCTSYLLLIRADLDPSFPKDCSLMLRRF
jgi:hypothetical protein